MIVTRFWEEHTRLFNDERINIIPILPSDKRPAIRWGEYQSNHYPRSRLARWAGNFAAVCGKVSNNLVVVDVEDPKLYDRFLKPIETFTVRTPNGGHHLFLRSRVKVGKIPKFCGLPIDIQGEGSYVLIPPSTIDGRAYEVVKDLEISEVHDAVGLLEERLPKSARAGKIEEFKQKISISSVIERYVKQKIQRKGYWVTNCPLHPDEHPSFTVYQDRFHCFGCGVHGDVIDFIQQIEGTDFRGAVRSLERSEGVEFFNQFIPKPRPGEKPEIDHARVADLIYELHAFKTFEDTEEVLFYRDGVYRRGGESLIKAEVERTMEGAGLAKRCTAHFVSEVIGHIRRRTFMKRTEFDSRPEILNLRNGLLDLNTLELYPHSPDLPFTVQLPLRYDPSAGYPRIGGFLREIVRGEDVPVLEEIAGYCLWHGYPIHKAFALLGDGANGKSTFLRLLEALLGEENRSAVKLQELETNRFASADLYGKLANIYADLEPTALRGTGRFKMLTGGDLIRGERKFKPSFTFYNHAKLIFSANRLPMSGDESSAFFRRWVIIDFPNKFEGERVDKRILEKLATPEELSGLLNAAIRALKRVLDRGEFSQSKTTEDVREDYIRKSDPVQAFAMDRLEADPTGEVAKDEVYEAFVGYCSELRLPVVAKAGFSKRLPMHVPVKASHPKIGGRRIWCWKGIRFGGVEGEVDGKEYFQRPLLKNT